jgi:bacterioferritin-associated ferredoxin
MGLLPTQEVVTIDVENDYHYRSRAQELLSMILCICRAVSDREVDDTIRRGANTAAAVGQTCGAGTDCGTCIGAIEDKLCGNSGPLCSAGPGAHSRDERPSQLSSLGG